MQLKHLSTKKGEKFPLKFPIYSSMGISWCLTLSTWDVILTSTCFNLLPVYINQTIMIGRKMDLHFSFAPIWNALRQALKKTSSLFKIKVYSDHLIANNLQHVLWIQIKVQIEFLFGLFWCLTRKFYSKMGENVFTCNSVLCEEIKSIPFQKESH